MPRIACVYSTGAAGDPVAALGRFGLDPSETYGVHQMSTTAATAPDGRPLTGIGGQPYGLDPKAGYQAQMDDHTHYLDAGTTSQWNLAAIVADQPQDITAAPPAPLALPDT